MNSALKREIVEVCEKNSGVEVCGFIYRERPNGAIYWCENRAADPSKDFEISTNDFIECMKLGEILGVFHSHPNEPNTFSEADVESAEMAAFPYYVYCLKNQDWLEYIPKSYEISPEGREFLWGFDDCYGALRNDYRESHGIYLRDYDRDESFQDISTDIYLDNFQREGFVRVEGGISQAKENDVLLFTGHTQYPQHVAVLKNGNKIFHHPRNRLSRIEPFDGGDLKHLHSIYRHRKLM